MTRLFSIALPLAVGLLASSRLPAVSITGQVSDIVSSNRVASARVTLFTPDLRIFREARTATNGTYRFDYTGWGTYQLGLASPGFEYQEITISVSNRPLALDFSLVAETNGGRWSIVGNTEPELIDGSGSGTLLPTGEIFFCHDPKTLSCSTR